MRIVFMGTPAFAVPSLETLITSDHTIVSVYTAPPRPANRGKKLSISPVHALANQHNIPVRTPASLKSDGIVNELRADKADVIIVVAYGMLLTPDVLQSAPHGCINVHPSALPRWRGAAPLQRTLMAGDDSTELCIMQMDEGLDTGGVLMRENFRINTPMNVASLSDALAQRAGPLLLRTLQSISDSSAVSTPQSEVGVTYAKKIRKVEALLDFSRYSAQELCHQINGLSPFPGAFITYRGERIKIHRASARNERSTFASGCIVNKQFDIQCNEGILCPEILQRAGKKPMASNDFLKGFTFEIGENVQPEQ